MSQPLLLVGPCRRRPRRPPAIRRTAPAALWWFRKDGGRFLYGDPLLDLVSALLFRRPEDEPTPRFPRGYRAVRADLSGGATRHVAGRQRWRISPPVLSQPVAPTSRPPLTMVVGTLKPYRCCAARPPGRRSNDWQPTSAVAAPSTT